MKSIGATIKLGRKSAFYILWLLEVCFIEGLYIYYMNSGQLFTTYYEPNFTFEIHHYAILWDDIQLYYPNRPNKILLTITIGNGKQCFLVNRVFGGHWTQK